MRLRKSSPILLSVALLLLRWFPCYGQHLSDEPRNSPISKARSVAQSARQNQAHDMPKAQAPKSMAAGGTGTVSNDGSFHGKCKVYANADAIRYECRN